MNNLREELMIYDLTVAEFGEIIGVNRKDLALYEKNDSRLVQYIKDRIELGLYVLDKYVLVKPSYDEIIYSSRTGWYRAINIYIYEFRQLLKQEKGSRS